MATRDVAQLRKSFARFDINGDGHISIRELGEALRAAGETVPAEPDLRAIIKEVDHDGSGFVEFPEFVAVIESMHEKGAQFTTKFSQIVSKMNVVKGSRDDIRHTFSDAEKFNFVEHINAELRDDPHCKTLLPLDPNTNDVFSAVSDGVLLAKLINKSVPGTIDERTLNLGAKKNVFQIQENQNLVINSSKAIGCQIINIHPESLMNGVPHLTLGLLWQVIKAGLFKDVSLKENPNLIVLLNPGEELSAFMKLPPDQILLRWFNYHLARAGHDRRVANFGSDVHDSVNYTVLLTQIAPDHCDRAPLDVGDLHERAEKVLQYADRIHCRKFVRPKDIVDANAKLNMAFVATLFNEHPGLELPKNQEVAVDGINWAELYGDESDSREARAFRMWINSLGVRPEVVNLFEDCKDGIVLLRMLDQISPGIVSWKAVSLQPSNKFKKVENCNYAVVLSKQLKFSLVGIGGSDIVDGNKKLTLALIWQAMRYYILNFMQGIKDEDIIRWANGKVKSAGKSSSCRDFRDKTLGNGVFLIDLLAACSPESVDYQFVHRGDSTTEKEENARFAIGCARKIGCTVFLLWEDIIEVKPKMIMTFIAAVMQRFQEGAKPASAAASSSS